MLEWLALLWTLELILRSQCSSEWQLSEKPVYIVICLLWPMKVSFDLLILYKLFYLNDCLVLQNNLKGPHKQNLTIFYIILNYLKYLTLSVNGSNTNLSRHHCVLFCSCHSLFISSSLATPSRIAKLIFII